jgi:hypothetical protein
MLGVEKVHALLESTQIVAIYTSPTVVPIKFPEYYRTQAMFTSNDLNATTYTRDIRSVAV